MHSIWKLWVTTKTEAKARRVYARVIDRMDCPATLLTIEPYPKIDGFVVTYQVALTSRAWNDAVVEVIALGQRFAYGWYISGTITQDPSATADRTSVAGVTMTEWHLIDDACLGQEG
jgi:hypothetical protein